ncbi:MAG: hypothetical protein ACYS9X_04220 [Planctomycetota bacterium]|jgi:hypothetical protein
MRSLRATLLSRPPLKRLGLILALGAAAIAVAAVYRSSIRPDPVPPDVAARGLADVRAILDLIGASEFGKGPRGAALTGEIERFLEDGRLVFTADISGEALYRKEFCADPVLYVGVFGCPRGHLLPDRAEIAERLYHEALHSVKRSGRKTREEECDAYCAAEEARASVDGRAPAFPLEREGRPLWEWVAATYEDAASDPAYVPVGQGLEDLMEKAGVARVRDAAAPR